MSEENNQTPVEETKVEIEAPTYKKEFVDKILTEKKNYAKMVNELTTKNKEYEEAMLKAKEDYKTIAEQKTKEVEEWKALHKAQETEKETAIKFSAVKKEFEKMGLKDSKTMDSLLNLVKLDAIQYDKDNKVVMGAEEAAKSIKESLPMVFSGAAPKMNHDAGGGAPSNITMESYKAIMKDGTWNKMSRQEQRDYEMKLWSSMGVVRK